MSVERRSLRHLLVTVPALLLVGCGGDQGAAPAVLNGSPVEDAGSGWTLSEEPEFSVSEGTAPEFQLFRVGSGVILEDGSLVVANGGASQLIFFDTDGRATHVAGGRGQGPGELGSVNGLVLTEDGVAASETGSRRVTFFSSSGDFTGILTLQDAGPSPLVGVAADGTVITAIFRSPPGERRRYHVWNERGEVIRELQGPPEPPLASISYSGAPSPVPGRPPVTINRALEAGCFARPAQAVLGMDVYALDAGAGRVLAIDRGGEVREVYRDPGQEAFTEARLDALRTRLAIGRPPPPADSVDAALARLAPVGAPLPSWDALDVDPSGRLWLRRASCPSRPEPHSYDVIDRDGRHLATVTIPEGHLLLAVRGDRVMVVRRDELGVEHLELYRLGS